MNQRLKYLLGFFLIVLGVVILAVSAFYNEMSFFVTPKILLEKKIKGVVRLGGYVENHHMQDDTHIFTVSDKKRSVTVHYKGALPPLFKEHQGIVVEGELIGNIFNAHQVFAKHDENYHPKNEGKSRRMQCSCLSTVVLLKTCDTKKNAIKKIFDYKDTFLVADHQYRA